MPAALPRITFTPSPTTHALLVRLSKATGAPLSACTRDMLETLNDHLRMLVMVLERTRGLNQSAVDAVQAAAEESALVMEPLLAEAARLMVRMATAMDEPALPLGSIEPPSSNTGVTGTARAKAN